MNTDFNLETVRQPMWGVFVDHEGNLECMFLEIVERVSGKNKKQMVTAIFMDKKEAEHFASACAKKWPDKGFYVQECKVALEL